MLPLAVTPQSNRSSYSLTRALRELLKLVACKCEWLLSGKLRVLLEWPELARQPPVDARRLGLPAYDRSRPRLCENSRDRFLPVDFSHVDAISGNTPASIHLLAILRGGRNEFSHSLGHDPSLAVLD
jgi:hypothetical protein